MEQKRKFLKTYLITIVVTLAIAAGFFCLFFFTNGKGYRGACDGCAYTGIILGSVGGLIFVSRNGFFDVFSYGFKQAGNSMFGKNPNKYKDFADYKEKGKAIRKQRSNYYVVLLIIGLVFIAVGIGFLFAYNASIK